MLLFNSDFACPTWGSAGILPSLGLLSGVIVENVFQVNLHTLTDQE